MPEDPADLVENTIDRATATSRARTENGYPNDSQ
jgi:hypothetical protein